MTKLYTPDDIKSYDGIYYTDIKNNLFKTISCLFNISIDYEGIPSREMKKLKLLQIMEKSKNSRVLFLWSAFD